MKLHYKKYRFMATVSLLCLLLAGCSKPQEEEKEKKDKTISEISIPGLLENCIGESGEYYYYTVSGESTIYQCTMDGTSVTQFSVAADNGKLNMQGFYGEQPADAADLSGLCIYRDTLYCYRGLNGTLMSVDINTGESQLLGIQETNGIAKMEAGENSVLLLAFGDVGKLLYVYHTDSGMMERVPVDNPVQIAFAGEDAYWINLQDQTGEYCFQEYRADTGVLSEKYRSNFTYELSDMTCSRETGLLYGRLYSIQYVCFDPRNPKAASRFAAQEVYNTPSYLQAAGGRLYIQDREQEKIYHFDPSAFVNQNEPLKGYITSEFSVTDWAGYNIELEVISWEELALKVLAEDRDYDFVVMTTDLAETTALRDAMAYLPIPEETIAAYWTDCWPCVREGASYNDDIWMLPLELYARGLVYNEQNLAKYEMSIGDIQTMADLCAAAKTLHSAGETGWYNLQPMQNHLLQEYLWRAKQGDTVNFDTPEFRAMMEFIREEYKSNSSTGYRNSSIQFNTWNMIYDENSPLTYAEQVNLEYQRQAARVYLDEVDGYSWDYEKYVGAEGVRVCTAQGMSEEEQPVQVNATLLILNPNTENKEEVLEFVAAMSETCIANPETYLSSDLECYSTDTVVQDVCGLYRNGEMVFGMPDGLFTSYYRYVMGQDLDKEEVIKELNRVVNMYYGE
ncbi:MAG: extracellular solute-binding protein [Lachnospiraceae bacterium]|nr:extracellular solute-binding protein [Lachnospiraceae bacterium]